MIWLNISTINSFITIYMHRYSSFKSCRLNSQTETLHENMVIAYKWFRNDHYFTLIIHDVKHSFLFIYTPWKWRHSLLSYYSYYMLFTCDFLNIFFNYSILHYWVVFFTFSNRKHLFAPFPLFIIKTLPPCVAKASEMSRLQ